MTGLRQNYQADIRTAPTSEKTLIRDALSAVHSNAVETAGWAFVRSTGNDTTGTVGNPALPYLSLAGAYADGGRWFDLESGSHLASTLTEVDITYRFRGLPDTEIHALEISSTTGADATLEILSDGNVKFHDISIYGQAGTSGAEGVEAVGGNGADGKNISVFLDRLVAVPSDFIQVIGGTGGAGGTGGVTGDGEDGFDGGNGGNGGNVTVEARSCSGFTYTIDGGLIGQGGAGGVGNSTTGNEGSSGSTAGTVTEINSFGVSQAEAEAGTDNIRLMTPLRVKQSIAANATGSMTGAEIRAALGISTLSGSNTGDQDLSSYATTSAVAAGYQPISSDLTAIDALVTTSTGRALLTESTAQTGTGGLVRETLPTIVGANFTGRVVNSTAGVSGTPSLLVNGTPFTGGGTTNTKPLVHIETAGATSTNHSNNGTMFSVNAPSGFTGNLAHFSGNGTSRHTFDYLGNYTAGNQISCVNVVANSIGGVNMNSTGVNFASTLGCRWYSGNTTDTLQTGTHQNAAGVVEFNSGTRGTLRWYVYGGTARVTADVTNSTTTMSNVTGLTVSLLAGRKYAGEVLLWVVDGSSEGVKFDFNGGTATMTSFAAAADIGGTTGTPVDGTLFSTAIGTALNWSSIGGTSLVRLNFTGVVNAAGTFQIRFAQNSHVVGSAVVNLNSTMQVEDLA